MTRLTLVVIALLLAMNSAVACHRFSYWAYPRPQVCRVTALAPKVRLPRARIDVSLGVARPPLQLPHRVATPTPEMALPSLSGIDWGQTLDDDQARGRLMLRGLLGKEDQ